MWKEPNPDPGGDSLKAPEGASADLTELKDENEQQKLLISQLKEMLRKDQNAVTQERVEEYINTLTKAKGKKSRVKRDDLGGSVSIDGVKKDRINLLKQQMEENKAKLAERGKNQKGIEEMVTQLKAQLNDSQQLINLTPLNMSLSDKFSEYSKDSSQEDLYNVLVLKERKITELLSKTQKQETAILDLQENLKEKDSVIDARTKAITLMTDSLSRKGKNTLDALDDTKEQMRRMQENFVILEGEMKARQMKLLGDLKTKNLEIAELRERLEEVRVDETPVDNLAEVLQKQLELLRRENEDYKRQNRDLEKRLQKSSDGDEVLKLKKQLDESNKSMIKIKAQSKSKVKELTKKIEAFKKMSDSNALIVQLQNEVTKLSEKIAELEEEKGNMQLKMVESTESKESTVQEETKDLQEKLRQNHEELEEKDKIISLLEADIISLREEIGGLNEKVQIESAQVTSEMKSIQIEEQLDKLEAENLALKDQIEAIDKQKKDLAEKNEELIREKQELGVKLDNYIQENIELIDKLEKLSAEKVSSAESIEIVEGLTQQEKLELAAYQKHVDVNLEEPKDEYPCEPPQELNDSVLQLNEDSAELLRKIEMFNAERKEVMSKMEALRGENSRLSMKITEVQNSRDVLVETYEQLQSEKWELEKEKDELAKKNGGQQELETLRQEQETLRLELSESTFKISELESKLRTTLEDLTNYQAIVEENKEELIHSSTVINELQMKLGVRENDIRDLNVLINDLNVVVNDLQRENEKLGNFELLESQVEELKAALDQQIEQAQDYAEEAARNNEITADLNKRLEELHGKISELVNELEVKTKELGDSKLESLQARETISNLRGQIEERDKKISLIGSEMRDKFLALQEQLDGNNGSLGARIEELTTKNKEQLEKMKKIAANLKKKTQAYIELEEKYNAEKEENNSRAARLEESEARVRHLEQDLQNAGMETQRKQAKVSEVSLKQEMSRSLHEEFEEEHGTKESANEEKLKELQLIIETNESDLIHYRHRLQKLEEELGWSAEEKDFLQGEVAKLEEKLAQTLQSVEEKTILEETLQQISADDEVLTKKLQQLTAEHAELQQKSKEQEELIHKLKVKVKKAQERINQLNSLQQTCDELEATNADLRTQLKHLEAHQKHCLEENEALQRRNVNDYEKVEADYQTQLEELLKSKNELLVDCEKLKESLGVSKEREEELVTELEDLKGRLVELEGKDEDLEEVRNDYSNSLAQIEDMKAQIEGLQKQLLVRAARETVEDVIVEAKERIFNMMTKQTQTEAVEIVEVDRHQMAAAQLPPMHALSDIESQIFTHADVTDNTKELRAIEYEKVDPMLGEQSMPVVEEVLRPKQAYLTYQPGVEAFGENDDGWGWGPEESKLEEEHQVMSEATPQMQNLRSQLMQAMETVQVLQVERENHLEEIKQLQVRSGKLIKKCKELKSQNEQLLSQKRGSSGDDFFNLDATIQEELKAQVEQLERKIKEVGVELERERAEKGNVLKRVDVLTAANERLVENKEIQDSEVFRWKRKFEEVEEKLRQAEWGSDGFSEGAKVKNTEGTGTETVEALQKTIEELSLDNEELQTLLNEQRELRIEAEKTKGSSNYLQVSEELQGKIRMLEAELTGRNEEIRGVLEEKSHMTRELQSMLQESNEVKEQLERDALQLQNVFREKDNALKVLREKMEKANEDNSKEERIQELTGTISELREAKKHLEFLLETNPNREEMEALKRGLSEAKALVNEQNITLNELKLSYDECVKLNESLTKQNEILSAELQELKSKYQELRETAATEIEDLKQRQNYSSQEGQTQQGVDVAVNQLTEQKSRLEKLLLEKEDQLVEVNRQLEEEDRRFRQELEDKQMDCEKLAEQMEEEFKRKIAELEEQWAEQVDERGNTVAESWKSHLAMVEEDFNAAREKLKGEINELEERCNTLLNKNNELRKNMDAEIKNEVDQMSTLQQSLTDLGRILNEKEQENLSLKERLLALEEAESRLNEIAALKMVVETTQQQFEEKREVVDEIVKILEKNSPWPISYEKEEVLSEFMRQINLVAAKEEEVRQLGEQIRLLQASAVVIGERDGEITRLKDSLRALQISCEEKQTQIASLTQTIDGLRSQVQVEKDKEATRLQEIIDEYRAQTIRLQEDIKIMNSQLAENQNKLYSYQQTQSSLEDTLNNKNFEISSLTSKLQQVETAKNDNGRDVERLYSEMESLRQTLDQVESFKSERTREIENLTAQLERMSTEKSHGDAEVERLQSELERSHNDFQHELGELSRALFTTRQELIAKEDNAQNLMSQVGYLQDNVELLNSEVGNLRGLLQSREQELAGNVQKSRLAELETHYEEVVAARNIDNDSLRSQLSEAMQNAQTLSEQLEAEVRLKQEHQNQCLQLEQKVTELEIVLQEDEKQLREMKDIIEAQVANIEQLKKELYLKSQDYDSLVAEMDIGDKRVVEQPVTIETPLSTTSTSKSNLEEDDDLSDPASRAELDLALYMLHQRDVRCEEFTIELTQLLEERDTLQLRLSNALRENDELRRKWTGLSEASASSASQEPGGGTPLGKSSAIFLAASGTELATEATPSGRNLADKLSELRRVGYKKDKTFVDEQQERRLQQMSIMQQHINEASRLPAEAAARLVDASYTLSRDVQSPSKVLLNWLWGRSTPKQDDT